MGSSKDNFTVLSPVERRDFRNQNLLNSNSYLVPRNHINRHCHCIDVINFKYRLATAVLRAHPNAYDLFSRVIARSMGSNSTQIIIASIQFG